LLAGHTLDLGKLADVHAEFGKHFRGKVDGEVIARKHRGGCDQRHHRDDGFGQHGPVADKPDVRFAAYHLGGRARADQRMESADGAAGDSDTDERPHFAGNDRSAAVNEFRDCRHVDHRIDNQYSHREQCDRPDLHVRAQIIAGTQKQPDRESGCDKSVNRENDRQRRAGKKKHLAERSSGDRLAENNAQYDDDHAHE
jgi:hypothetical protein